MEVIKNIINIGQDNPKQTLFEGQYKIEHGIRYNSYLILDDKTCLVDTIDREVSQQWFEDLQKALDGRNLDYLVVSHLEPDHAYSIPMILKAYKDVKIVITMAGFKMLQNFLNDYTFNNDNITFAKEGDVLSLGEHNLKFIMAAFIHWPEVMMEYEMTTKTLFSADAFGRFGTYDYNDDNLDESRRYYIGIVGKYGSFVKNLLTKAGNLEINRIAPLHGNVIEKDSLGKYLDAYSKWASYQSEDNDVTIVVSSVYGNTLDASKFLENELIKAGKKVNLFYLNHDDFHQAISYSFKSQNLVLFSITYNNDIFPVMKSYIDGLKERNFQNKNVYLIENGSWGPLANKLEKEMFSEMKDIKILKELRIMSRMNQKNKEELISLAKEI